MKKLIAILASFGLLTGCGAYFPYQEYNEFWGGGYLDTQLAENVFRVSYIGDGDIKWEVKDFALLRAAEVCLENNFRYFVVKETDAYTETAIDYSTYARSEEEIDYRISNIIIGFREKPDIDTMVYDAEFISKSIRAKFEK